MKKCILFVLCLFCLSGINAGPTKIVKDAQPAQNWWMCSGYTGYDSCVPGDKIYLHGNGFANFCYVYLNGPKTGFVTVGSVKPGEITFTAPSWPVGVYDVWLYNNESWAKFDSQLTISTKQALGLNFDATIIEAPVPSGGDDWQALQNLCTDANSTGDQTAPPSTLNLQAGTYKLSKPLVCVGHWGSVVALQGQGRDKTILQLIGDVVDSDVAFIRTESISSLKVDVGNFKTIAAPAVAARRIVDSDIFSTNSQNSIFTAGGGSERMYIVNCNITGCGVFCNSLKSGFIINNNFFLDGYTESALFMWTINNVHAANLTAREYNGTYNGQRGRIFCGAYNCKNIYLENLQTFNLAGTNVDSNCGEQILFDGDPLKHVTTNLYVYNCKMQGKSEVLDGASCGMEIYNAAVNCYVNGLTVDRCVSGMNFLGTQLNCKIQNIKATNCRIGIRTFAPATVYNLTATGIINKAVWLGDNNIVGNTSNLTLIDSTIQDAPIGVGNQDPITGTGTLNLVNSRIYAGRSPITGSDAKNTVNLQGYSGIFNYPINSVTQPRPFPPLGILK